MVEDPLNPGHSLHPNDPRVPYQCPEPGCGVRISAATSLGKFRAVTGHQTEHTIDVLTRQNNKRGMGAEPSAESMRWTPGDEEIEHWKSIFNDRRGNARR